MIDANFILSKLPPYTAKEVVIEQNQSVNDIKKAILKAFEADKKQYAAIAPYFVGNTVKDTCKNVWKFLRDNVKNVTESADLQSVKTPSAIIATGQTTGSDCKNYSLFVGGILDAINRSGLQAIPIAFRFCRYKQFDGSYLDHVFIVVYPKTKNEIWVDCINDVPYFDAKRYPDYFTDTKINSMALVRMSGMSNMPKDAIINGLLTERAKRLSNGTMKANSVQDMRYKKALAAIGDFDPSNIVAPPPSSNSAYNLITSSGSPTSWLNGLSNGVLSNILNATPTTTTTTGNNDVETLVAAGVDSQLPGASALVKPLFNLFSSVFGNKPNPNDWQGWDAQTAPIAGKSAAWWTITDGDSPQNEMVNVLSYMKNAPNGMANTFAAAQSQFNLTPQQFAAKLIAKLNRTGFTTQATQFSNLINTATSSTALQTGAPSTDTKAKTNSLTSILPYLIGGLVVAKVTKII